MGEPDPILRAFQTLLHQRVGGFFHNTVSLPGVTCEVCSGPGAPVCERCAEHRGRFGGALADQILTLTYVRGSARSIHQSAAVMWAYKREPGRSIKAADDLALMVAAATRAHGACSAAVTGMPWDGLAFVPSTRNPGKEHPVSGLARQVFGVSTDRWFRLSLGPGAADTSRTVRRDRFQVDHEWRPRLHGRHVLLVDDTWTTGCKAQSAALAVREAGAAMVTVLCVARWCRHDWPDHRALLDQCTAPYDALVCPITRGSCPAR